MVQPLFSGKVFAQYKLILLPFSVRNLIAPQPQTIVPNPIPPGTSPPPDELGEALFLFSFIPLHCHLKRQLPHLLTVHPFKLYIMRNMRFCNIFHTHPLTGTLSRQVHPLYRRGLGRPLFPLSFSSLGLGRLLLHFSNISVHSPTCSQILKI